MDPSTRGRTGLSALLLLLLISIPKPGAAQAPVTYDLRFPEPEHHWMEVEVVFPEVTADVLQVRMSRTSPKNRTPVSTVASTSATG